MSLHHELARHAAETRMAVQGDVGAVVYLGPGASEEKTFDAIVGPLELATVDRFVGSELRRREREQVEVQLSAVPGQIQLEGKVRLAAHPGGDFFIEAVSFASAAAGNHPGWVRFTAWRWSLVAVERRGLTQRGG